MGEEEERKGEDFVDDYDTSIETRRKRKEPIPEWDVTGAKVFQLSDFKEEARERPTLKFPRH